MLNTVKFIPKIAFLIIASILFFSISAESQDTIKIDYIKGAPKIMKAGSNEWTICRPDMVVNEGDRINTGKGELVEVIFAHDGSNRVRIEENSDIVLKRGQNPYSIELINGAAMSLIKKLSKGSTFEVRTPSGLSGARGTGWRTATNGSRSTFSAFENSIYTKGIDASGKEMDGELIVDSGWKTTVGKFERPSGLERLTDGDMEIWNSWKNELSARGESAGSSTDRLDKAESADNRIESLESRKDAVNEARDEERIEQQERSPGQQKKSGGSGSYTLTGS